MSWETSCLLSLLHFIYLVYVAFLSIINKLKNLLIIIFLKAVRVYIEFDLKSDITDIFEIQKVILYSI